MTSDYDAYCKEVLEDSLIITHAWQRRLVLEMLQELWDNDVIVEYVWAMSSGYPTIVVNALAVDTDNSECEVVATWAYDKELQSEPDAWPWIMVDLELKDVASEAEIDNDD